MYSPRCSRSLTVPSKVFPIRATEAERAGWQLAAEGAALSFNAWARRSLNEQAEMERALAREALTEAARGQSVSAEMSSPEKGAADPGGHAHSPRLNGGPFAVSVSADLGGKFRPDPRKG